MGENYFGITDTGRQRTNNEDRFIAQTAFDNQFIIACVIDGVGGYAGGEVAAQLAHDAIIDNLDTLPDNMIDRMTSALWEANEKITGEKKENLQNNQMACVLTLAAVDIEKNILYYAHIGDTRLYLFRDGSLIKVTKDHSTVGFLEESGRLTEAAAMQHPKRNEVNKALGFDSNLPLTKDFIDTGESPFLPGDTILICSDGLTDMITSSRIISILNDESNLSEKGQTLINAANIAGGKDNITVVLVHNDKTPLQHEATKPLVTLKKDNQNDEVALEVAGKDSTYTTLPIKKNAGKKNNELLLFLCIIFFLGFAYLLYKNYNANKNIEKPLQTVLPKQQNLQELSLLDSINAASGKVIKLNGSEPIIISDSVVITKDSLHIIGNGISLVRDSAYIGPALILSAACKYILLDSMTIENFNVGIMVLNKGLHLKNVRFKNCFVPMQFQQYLAQDTVISGRQAETNFYFTDSLHK